MSNKNVEVFEIAYRVDGERYFAEVGYEDGSVFSKDDKLLFKFKADFFPKQFLPSIIAAMLVHSHMREVSVVGDIDLDSIGFLQMPTAFNQKAVSNG